MSLLSAIQCREEGRALFGAEATSALALFICVKNSKAWNLIFRPASMTLDRIFALAHKVSTQRVAKASGREHVFTRQRWFLWCLSCRTCSARSDCRTLSIIEPLRQPCDFRTLQSCDVRAQLRQVYVSSARLVMPYLAHDDGTRVVRNHASHKVCVMIAAELDAHPTMHVTICLDQRLR